MPSVTLAQSALLAQDELIAGVIEDIITVNRIFDIMPFDGIEGNALAYNRELAEAGVEFTTVDTDLSSATAKDPATFVQVTSSLTSIIGDAEVNGLIQATRSGDGNDQTGVQVAAKAKALGRAYQDTMINGTGAGNTFAGLASLVSVGQTILPSGGNPGAYDLGDLDALIDLVVDKDGQVDYLCMSARPLRSYYGLLRGLGGASIADTVSLPSGEEVPGYRGIPIFRNDWIPENGGVGIDETLIFAGTFDDGSRQHGVAGLTADQASGIQVVDVGESETTDNHITRVKWYCGLALFSDLGLAMLEEVTN
jgi:hypothetical protein